MWFTRDHDIEMLQHTILEEAAAADAGRYFDIHISSLSCNLICLSINPGSMDGAHGCTKLNTFIGNVVGG